MIDRRIVGFLARRGTDAERIQVLFEPGEIVYTTDTKRVYIGDGTTLGGIPVSNQNSSTSTFSTNSSIGDFVYRPDLLRTYVATSSGYTYIGPYPDEQSINFLDNKLQVASAGITYVKLNQNVAASNGGIVHTPVGLSINYDPATLGISLQNQLYVKESSNSNSSLTATDLTLLNATLSTFSLPLTAKEEFLLMNINGTTQAIQLWNLPTGLEKAILYVEYVGVGGSYHTIFIGKNGEAFAAGDNASGQLGLGDNVNRNTPTLINLPPVKAAEGGNGHTLFLGTDGSVSACGLNNNGQLGLGDNISRNTPTKLNISNVKMIACGSIYGASGSYSIFLGIDGTVSACGSNSDGQLGLGDTIDRNIPAKLNISNVAKIFAGVKATYFIGVDGSLSACGYNNYGQLGNGNKISSSIPIKIDIPLIEMVSPGVFNCLFLGTDGSVSACGYNRWGELGGGAFNHRDNPTKLNLPPVRTVGLRYDSSFFLGTDNTISACGDNSHGQYGNGTISNFVNPTSINLPPISTFSIGFDSTFYVGMDGSVSACGYNDSGLLGLGDNIRKTTPVRVTR